MAEQAPLLRVFLALKNPEEEKKEVPHVAQLQLLLPTYSFFGFAMISETISNGQVSHIDLYISLSVRCVDHH